MDVDAGGSDSPGLFASATLSLTSVRSLSCIIRGRLYLSVCSHAHTHKPPFITYSAAASVVLAHILNTQCYCSILTFMKTDKRRKAAAYFIIQHVHSTESVLCMEHIRKAEIGEVKKPKPPLLNNCSSGVMVSVHLDLLWPKFLNSNFWFSQHVETHIP